MLAPSPFPTLNPAAAPSAHSTLQESSDSLTHQLQMFGELRFTGRVDIQFLTAPVSSLYFCLGRLVWFGGGHHPIQRWRRLLTQFCPDLDGTSLPALETIAQGTQGYEFLCQALQQGQIRREQMVTLIETALSEILFDLLQEQESFAPGGGFDLCHIHANTEDTVSSPLTLVRLEEMLDRAQSALHLWETSGLAAYSPHLVPTIRRKEQLRQQTTPATYELLSTLLDGQRSLRSLAVKMNRDLITLTRALLPFVSHGTVSLVEIPTPPEFSSPTTDILALSPDLLQPVEASAPQATPLVVGIDDSSQVCKNLELTLTQANYRFVGVTDPLQALPLLLKLKPDVILLDLEMPVASGYELCAQIRRSSELKHTPVIILTEHGNVVDRVRAKWVGGTELLAKPVAEEQLLEVMERHLGAISEQR